MDPSHLSPFPLIPLLHSGLVIPAHPLALTENRKLDERRQRALTRYYLDAGAGGLAVGVHTTQFAIREPRYGLFEPVLSLAAETISSWEAGHSRKLVRVAGVCGGTTQAVNEAQLARNLGYHAGLLSLSAFQDASVEEMIAHARAVAEVIPLFGFYLQPAVGGVHLPYRFWQIFLEIPEVVAVKVAPFNRYDSLEVQRALASSGRLGEVALYTGNDDHILLDLLGDTAFETGAGAVRVGFQGGLLGHWACWTRRAVEQLEACKAARRKGSIPSKLISLAGQVTDCNTAFFDAAHHFAGVLCGIHEVLRRQGLLANHYCLDERERLSPGQSEEIDRVYCQYPHLNDDEFVRENLDRWLRD